MAAPSWTGASRVSVRKPGWRLPGSLSREVVFDQGRHILVADGLTTGDRSSARVWSIDPGTGRVSAQPDLPQPVHDAAGLLLHDAPTLVGGGNTRELRQVHRRDAAGRWRSVGQLPGSRSDCLRWPYPAAVWSSAGTTVGPRHRPCCRPPTVSVSPGFRASPHGVRYAAAVRSGAVVWVIGGEDAGAQLPWVQRLDLRSGRVTVTGRWPVRLGHAATVAVGTRVLVLGGRTSGRHVTDAMWWFDPASGTITAAGRLPYAVADAGLVVTSDAAYLVGGKAPTSDATCWWSGPCGDRKRGRQPDSKGSAQRESQRSSTGRPGGRSRRRRTRGRTGTHPARCGGALGVRTAHPDTANTVLLVVQPSLSASAARWK